MAKRFLDLLLVFFALPVVIPTALVVALLIRLSLGSPVLFRQNRPGLHGRNFRMVKFRTMLDARDAKGALLPDAQRLTPLGRFLRASSLDEIPELWNVVKGDMSLVGPRPLLVEYLPLYTPQQARRHEVRPGITGWAQINGRNTLTWDDKFRLDVWYVDNQSLLLDVQILATTVLKVLSRADIDEPDGVGQSRYTGGAE